MVPALNFLLGLLEWRAMLRYPDTQRTLGKEDIFMLADLRRHATLWGLHKGASVWVRKQRYRDGEKTFSVILSRSIMGVLDLAS